jgi:isocitrate dehydrogenase
MKDITVAMGDGIGPEIMQSVLSVLNAAKAPIRAHVITIGETAYLAGHSSGISNDAWETILANKVLLKAPITTPQGGGYKSLNVTLRKKLGLFSNVRPCKSYMPYVESKHPTMDMVVIRENEEDLYAGIEHQQTDEVVQCLKLITRPGCERIVRYAFEYARTRGRKKITCLTKDNIMKQTDGLFRTVFNEIANFYPDIQVEHQIIDIGMARVADTPERFDVVLVPNLYGDILSDVAAQIAGSVGLAGSANIGMQHAMFEAIHGSAPDIAGQNIANPSGLLQAAIMMLHHIGESAVANTIHNAWLATLEAGIHTADIFVEGKSKQKASTTEFTKAIIERLGSEPKVLQPESHSDSAAIQITPYRRLPKAKKELYGVDLFVHWPGSNPEVLAKDLQRVEIEELELTMITNRGVTVWPDGIDTTFCTDHWRCRFESRYQKPLHNGHILDLMARAVLEKVDVIKTENLYHFDGKPAFSMGQGQQKKKLSGTTEPLV